MFIKPAQNRKPQCKVTELKSKLILPFLGLACASLLRTIFASLARTNERVHVQNVRNFPQAKLDSEIEARFLLNEHGGLYFLLPDNNIANVILFNLKKKLKKFIGRKKDIAESVYKTVTLG